MVLGAVMLVTMACPSTATILSYVDQVLTIAASVAATTGILPPGVATYLNAAMDGVNCASTEAASIDPPVGKATKITACVVGIAAPLLPPGTALTIVTDVEKVSQALQNILVHVPTPAAATAATGKKSVLVFSDSDRVKLLSYAAQAKDIKSKLAARK